jgi:hypothetical protein
VIRDFGHLRDQVISEVTRSPGWSKDEATELVDELLGAHAEELGVETALALATARDGEWWARWFATHSKEEHIELARLLEGHQP